MHKPNRVISLLNVDMLNTDKQGVEDKPRYSESSFGTVFERSPVGNLILAKDLTILHANPALVTALGLSSVSMIAGTNILLFAHPDHRGDWILLQQNLWLNQLPSFTIETCLLKRNGSGVWCKLTAIAYQEGSSTLSYTMVEDISKQKNDEETIKRSKANLLTILNNADSAYVLYNSKLQIVSFNKLAEKFAGMLYSKDLEEDSFLLDYFPADRHDALLDVTQRVMNGEDITYERAIKNNDGLEWWMEAKWINVKDADDKSWGFILASKDITEGKLAAIERERITPGVNTA